MKTTMRSKQDSLHYQSLKIHVSMQSAYRATAGQPENQFPCQPQFLPARWLKSSSSSQGYIKQTHINAVDSGDCLVSVLNFKRNKLVEPLAFGKAP